MNVLEKVRIPQVRLPDVMLPESVARAMRPQAMPSGINGWIDAHLMPLGDHDGLYPRAVGLLDLQPDDDLVEVACGVGALLQRHAPRTRFVAGLDHSPLQVGFARKRLADRIAAGTAEVVLGDAAALPWQDGRFSAAVCVGGLELMPEPAAAIRELRRVLRAGGRAAFTAGTCPDDDAAARRRSEALGFWAPTEAQVRDITRDAGFAEVEISYMGTPPGLGGAIELWLSRATFGASQMRFVRTVVGP
jgi:demethylmenaquinone methyltransferase/2-methoxy-6-polyprenyl-1,4-benzoquinol methylase